MTDGPRPPASSWRALFRKNTPAETRENWNLVRSGGRFWGRLFVLLLAIALLFPFAAIMYARGYFDGTQAARPETISTESNHVRH